MYLTKEHFGCVYSELCSQGGKSVQQVKDWERFPEMSVFTFVQLHSIIHPPFPFIFDFASGEAALFSFIWLLSSLFWGAWCLRAL